jgi:hypothetical protein
MAEAISAAILLKNKHQAVSQGVWRFGKRSIFIICEHLQKPHNAGSRFQARFFNTLINPGSKGNTQAQSVAPEKRRLQNG